MNGMARGLETLQPSASHACLSIALGEAITEYALRGEWRESIGVLSVAREEALHLDLQLYRKLINGLRENGQWAMCMEVLRFLKKAGAEGLRATPVRLLAL